MGLGPGIIRRDLSRPQEPAVRKDYDGNCIAPLWPAYVSGVMLYLSTGVS